MDFMETGTMGGRDGDWGQECSMYMQVVLHSKFNFKETWF